MKNKTFIELLDSLNIKQYLDTDITKSIIPPEKEVEESDIELFNVGRCVASDELEKEYNSRGLQAIDPYSLASYYKGNPERYKYLGTHWKDGSGKWCHIAFGRWDGDERGVNVNRDGSLWGDCWWFAGVRKNSVLNTSLLSEPLSSELKEIKRPQYHIGSLIMHCGNIYNEQGVEISKEVGKYIFENYNLKTDAKKD